MAVSIRPARQEDQQTIVSFIRQAKINPRNLHWEHFLVAEENGKVVGMRQVKVHAQGTREIASGFVLPEYRHQGVSARLMHELLTLENSPLYTMVDEKWIPYYEQFGFRLAGLDELPPDFHEEYQIGKLITSLISFFRKDKIRIIPLKRE